MTKITVIGRDNSNTRNGYEAVLIYEVEVENLEHDTVLAAFIESRGDDLGDEPDEDDIDILFAFAEI